MASLRAGLPHDLKYGKQAKLRSMHNHYMTFPVLFMMLGAHFPQLTSAARNVPILGVIIVALMMVKYLMNSRYHFRHWLLSIFATFIVACVLIGTLLAVPTARDSPPPRRVFWMGPSCSSARAARRAIRPARRRSHRTCTAFSIPRRFSQTTRKSSPTEAYLRESIRQPQLRIVKGYAAAMPPFAHLSEAQVERSGGLFEVALNSLRQPAGDRFPALFEGGAPLGQSRSGGERVLAVPRKPVEGNRAFMAAQALGLGHRALHQNPVQADERIRPKTPPTSQDVAAPCCRWR